MILLKKHKRTYIIITQMLLLSFSLLLLARHPPRWRKLNMSVLIDNNSQEQQDKGALLRKAVQFVDFSVAGGWWSQIRSMIIVVLAVILGPTQSYLLVYSSSWYYIQLQPVLWRVLLLQRHANLLHKMFAWPW